MNPDPHIHKSVIPREKLILSDGKLVNHTQEQIFELIRDITDPEHPQTLEELNVVDPSLIHIYEDKEEGTNIRCCGVVKIISVSFRPTIQFCSMASLIGLSLKIQLMKYINDEYLVLVNVAKDGHVQERELNKQLNDKDRVNAAMESESVMILVNELIPNLVSD